MCWADFKHELQLKVVFQEPPEIIVVHLGGNDLVKTSNLTLFRNIREGLGYVSDAFPEACILWTDVLQRLEWHSVMGNVSVEKKRRRVNRFGRQVIRGMPRGEVLQHDIDYNTPGFFRPDGVHLSDVGLDMYLDALMDKLSSLL